jgi:predicted HNH restriction endonuclease
MVRQLWLRSRERAAALKAANYTCQECGAKQSKRKGAEVKIEVHHIDGINGWEKVFKIIREEILVPPKKLRVLCEACHLKEKNG